MEKPFNESEINITKIFAEDTEITKFPSVIDLLGGVTAKPDEVVDTPTPLVAGTTNKLAGIGIFIVIGIVIFFILKRKK